MNLVSHQAALLAATMIESRHRDDHRGRCTSPVHPRDHGREPLPV